MLMLFLAAQVTATDPGPKVDLVPIILKTMRASLLDPESARDLKVCEPKSNGTDWVYFYSYRAKNGMGGYTMAGYTTVVTGGKVTGTLGGGDALGQSLVSMTTECPAIDAARLAEAMK